MRNVYKVEYDELTQIENQRTRVKVNRGWFGGIGSLHVLSNGSVDNAIKKAKKHLLSRVERFKEEDGTLLIQRTLKVRITSCEHAMSIDI